MMNRSVVGWLQSRFDVVWGPGPDRLMGPPWGKVLGVGTIVLCTSKSGNTQLGPVNLVCLKAAGDLPADSVPGR